MNSLPSTRVEVVKKQDDKFAAPHPRQGVTQFAVALANAEQTSDNNQQT